MSKIERIFTIVAIVILLAGCAPSEGAVQTAIAETQLAGPTATQIQPTRTPIPTRTTIPTLTLKPTRTAAPSKTPTLTPEPPSEEELRETFAESMTIILETLSDSVVAINMVRWNGEDMEIEVRVDMASPENIYPLHFQIVQLLAILFEEGDDETAGFSPILKPETRLIFTTLAGFGDGKFTSTNDMDTMTKLRDKQITQDEWKALSGYTGK